MKSFALSGLKAMHRLASHFPKVGAFQPLRGGFSAFSLLKKGELEGEVIAEGQAPGKCPPGSMTEKAGFRQHDHQPWPVFWVKSHDARLVGNMFHWRNQKDEICMEGVYQHPQRLRLGEDNLTAQAFLPQAEVLEGAWTSIVSNWNEGGNYYHWILDGLSRLAIRDYLPEDTKIIIPRKSPRFVTDTIQMLGLESHVFSPEAKLVTPERFYFCAPTAMTGVRNPLGYAWLRKNFNIHFAIENSGNPVFLTRRGSARIPDNLQALENLFLCKGFEIVDCGSLTVKEQIHKVSGAQAVVGLHGAAMTNLLWAAKGTPVLEIFEPGYLNGCYEQIAFHGELNYRHLINGTDLVDKTILEWLSR